MTRDSPLDTSPELETIKAMPSWNDSELSVQVLGQGWANKNFLVHRDSDRWVVKILTQALDELQLSVPLQHVMRNTELAGRARVGAAVVARFDDPAALVLLDGRTLDPADIGKPDMLNRVARAIRWLHRETEPFRNEVSVWDFIDHYLALVDRHGLRTPEGLTAMLPTIREIECALEDEPLELVPSQIDTYSWNLLDTDGEIRIIDYDFSGMSDELFDVADVAMERDLDCDATARLVESYFGGHHPRLMARAQLLGIAAQYMWSLLFTDIAQLLPELPSDELDYFGEAVSRWQWVERQVDSLGVGSLLQVVAGVS
jgi:thiamine kinase-like enzyme